MKNTRKQQKERLQQLSLHLGLTLRDIARIADLSEATLYHVTDGTREMSGKTASRICNQLKQEKGVLVNRDWLLKGEGEMIDEKHTLPYKEEDTQPRIEKKNREDVEDYREKYNELLEDYKKLVKINADLMNRYLELTEK
jgi:transcriptional regulator with XRE-family HTH domain